MEKYPESRYSLKYLCCTINILAHTTSPGLTYRQPLVFFIRRGGTIYILLDFIFKKIIICRRTCLITCFLVLNFSLQWKGEVIEVHMLSTGPLCMCASASCRL